MASFLVETREMRGESRPFLLNFFSGDTPFFTKERFFGVSCFCVHETTGILQLSYASSMLLAMDQTAANFPFTWNAYRSDERQSRTVGGKRAGAAPTDHPASTDQMPRLPEDGSGCAGYVAHPF